MMTMRSDTTNSPRSRGSFLTGCLAVLAVLIVIAIIAGFWVRANYRGWFASGAISMVEAGLEDSELTEEQRAAIMVEVRELADDYRERRITNQQMVSVFEEVAQSPLIPMGAVYAVDSEYVQPSEMSTEEKAEARLALQRVARGFYEESISQDELESVLEPISKRQPEGEEGFNIDLQEPSAVSIEELRRFIERADAAADAAGVPEEPYEIDIAAELGMAIDRALGRETPDDPALLPPGEAEAPVDESDPDPAPPAEPDAPGGG